MGYAVITGASSGIGRELAQLLAADGHDVVLVARNEERLNALKTILETRYNIHAAVLAKDLSAANAAAEVYEFTSSQGLEIDTLINNAGFADWTEFLDADWSRQHSMMQLNMHALAELSYRYGNDMRQVGRGRILNISSIASMMAGPYMAMYFASKSFVRSFSEALAYELRGTGVTVTCVCPGPTSTNFASAAHMGGSNFFTMTKPATAAQLARYAYRAMLSGRVLAYHGLLTKAGSFAERALPRAFTRHIAARMNGGSPSEAKR